ncbi:MAG: hypothetical protein LBI71_09835 [Enterobacteriaceae bacterium]|nr:hypothetical protein [Enterobacteriaceae bacterium]
MDNQEIDLNSRENGVSLAKETEVFIREGQAVGAGDATKWIGNAWAMFKAQPLQWILMLIVYIAIISVISFIPFISLFSGLFSSVFVAGYITAAHQQRITGNFRIELLFYGFKNKLGSLVAVGALNIGIITLGVIAALIIAGFGALDFFVASQSGNPDPVLMLANLPSFMWAIIILSIFSMVASAFVWFAPALIIINDMKFGEAISMSLSAVKKNLFGGFLFFFMMGVLMFISMIPIFLGLLVTIPMMMISYYTTYRSIFYASKEVSNKEKMIV